MYNLKRTRPPLEDGPGLIPHRTPYVIALLKSPVTGRALYDALARIRNENGISSDGT